MIKQTSTNWVLMRRSRRLNVPQHVFVLGTFPTRQLACKWAVPCMRDEARYITRLSHVAPPSDTTLAWLRTMEEHIQRENFSAAFGVLRKHLWEDCEYWWDLQAIPFYEET